MAEHLVKLWIRADEDPSGIDWQAWLPNGVRVEQVEMACVALGSEAHPLAQWLRHVADNLDCIYVRGRDTETGRWVNASLAALEFEEAAWHVARWLLQNRVPVAVPARKEEP